MDAGRGRELVDDVTDAFTGAGCAGRDRGQLTGRIALLDCLGIGAIAGAWLLPTLRERFAINQLVAGGSARMISTDVFTKKLIDNDIVALTQ